MSGGRRARPLAIAVGFLTRVPVATGAVDDAALAAALVWFPAVGGALGLAAAGAAHLAAGVLALPPLVGAALVVALLAAATGGLHLDGVADVFDGMGGGKGDRDRTLAIMRDSRIGAHGAVALALVLIAKVAAVAALIATGAGWAVACAPVIGRWAVVPLVVGFPYARPAGLGRAMSDHGRPRHLVGATLVAAASVAWAGTAALVPTAVALAAALALAGWVRARVGGLTGDVYGAAIELAELGFLIAASRG